jgi:putative PIN family toxin of toxin-antitoxin system
MRVVIDTNVFISAALKQSSLPAVAVRFAILEGTLLKSSVTERELRDVLIRPQLATLIPQQSLGWINELLGAAELIAVTAKIRACRDPDDHKFIELAIDGRADFLVSGDADLLILDPFRGIPIVSPAIFLDRVRR